MMKKLLLFTGDIETLGFFSEQMLPAFTELGYTVHLYNFLTDEDTIASVRNFLSNGECTLITFNFIGLCGEGSQLFEENGISFWEQYNVTCINIIVDHPFYYHDHLQQIPTRYLQFCVDRQHVRYMERFYPHIRLGGYLPLAGTALNFPQIPYIKRTQDIIFTGNYTPPSQFQHYIDRNGDEYAHFYQLMIDELITQPHRSMDDVMEQYIRQEVEDYTEDTLKDCMANLIFIDLYTRFFYRGQVIRTLADSGIPIHLYGSGWDHLDVKHRENLIIHGPLDSIGCLQQIATSKLSLNVMPWFKEGLHDRIMNSMLNGAVSVSDSSLAIEEEFTNQETICLYQLEETKKLPEQIEDLLTHENVASDIAQASRQFCLEHHTWANRAKTLHKTIETLDF